MDVLSAPMPGVVKAIDCAVDEMVEEGTTLVTLEAMKMQNPLISPKSGKVQNSLFSLVNDVIRFS